jgi:alkanesulfonate monooxygenase SsuD/methylene tetrahydromethanopterin reductase-like flavin-dependent oxidoreductase (luciferase family)
MSYLRSGIFLAPFHNLTENPTLAIDRDMELLQHIDRLNYHEAWIGEHAHGISGWAPAWRRCRTTIRSCWPTAWCSLTT